MLRLIRLDHNYIDQDNNKQFGVLVVNGIPLVTIERPWLPMEKYPAGKPSFSCVPPGRYKLVKAYSPKYKKEMWYLENKELGVVVRKEQKKEDWHRWGCMFHPANWVRQINGCIAPGSTIALMGDDVGVTDSRNSNDLLYKYLEKESNPEILIDWS